MLSVGQMLQKSDYNSMANEELEMQPESLVQASRHAVGTNLLAQTEGISYEKTLQGIGN